MQFGKNITQSGDPLSKIAVERLFKGISRPKPAFRDLVEQLRMVKTIDEKQYRELKKKLPYFVCGHFHPAVRRGENFTTIEYFMLDLDHLQTAAINSEALRATLRTLPEVVMYFLSPSADGLKIMFKLTERCSDRALFSTFYKIFATRFAQRYGLERVTDYRTSDVTRACFLSYDPAAYFNPAAVAVDLQQYLPSADYEQVRSEIKAAQVVIQQQPNRQATTTSEPEADILLKIKRKLNPNYRPPQPKKNYYVPPQITEALPQIETELAATGVKLVSADPINYGKKLRFVADKLWAEINIFHGRNGFKVVATTKSGSNQELAKLTAQLIEEILYRDGEE